MRQRSPSSSNRQGANQNSEVGHQQQIGRQRRPRSINSPNSSLSSYSPPWTMTQRPQSQSITWPEDDLLTDDGEGGPSVMSVATAMSSWQEEAHWMSFRNAVQYFSALTIHESPANEQSLAGSPASSFAASATTILSSPENPPPVRQIVGVNDQSSTTTPSLDSPDRGTSTFTNSSTAGTSRAGDSVKNNNYTESPASKKSMASDLAETKMRLALAQAERDELEFALMRGGNSDTSISGI